ncbi:poxvirus late transcription factor VLTF3-like protein [Acanthamoeba polyphaga mimivirus]|uniref:Poxvirus late transcription factor VLTF3-like protein n=1 Tax=Acanthamoeba polyphaga mimivirus Kroon TaxID=3069720 RepID=A0A0G2Y8M4_9VIRU|nr:poxvirus late transcription factor VLTF3-like protein [Acanthamoeba polyphaga mimivirus]AKI80162.1 poxvirus late transcription factor VLTF3-like protein [Acanthamoeba polyphaga mimivirus Kroon]
MEKNFTADDLIVTDNNSIDNDKIDNDKIDKNTTVDSLTNDLNKLSLKSPSNKSSVPNKIFFSKKTFFKIKLDEIKSCHNIAIYDINSIKNEIESKNLQIDEINTIIIKKILKKLGLYKYCGHEQYILNIIIGKPVQKMSSQEKNLIMKLFDQVLVTFNLLKKKYNWNNFLHNGYLIYQLCKLSGLNDFLDNITLPNNETIIHVNNQAWKQICSHNHWIYYGITQKN